MQRCAYVSCRQPVGEEHRPACPYYVLFGSRRVRPSQAAPEARSRVRLAAVRACTVASVGIAFWYAWQHDGWRLFAMLFVAAVLQLLSDDLARREP